MSANSEKNTDYKAAEQRLVSDRLDWAGQVLPNRLMLAPMAGPGALPFRRICEEFGAGLTVTELCSARGICYDPDFKRNDRYLTIAGLKGPAAIQLFGSDADDMFRAVSRVLAEPAYESCACIDINMGCPMTKVVKTGAGAALMRTPDLAASLVEAAVKAARPFGKEVTVKFRSGWAEGEITAPAFAKKMEEAGAAALTLHARSREAMYSGKADWQVIAATKAQVNIHLAANGDIATYEDCHLLLEDYGADALMLGRSTLGRPWLFAEILAQEAGRNFEKPKGELWSELVQRHLKLLCQYRGAEAGVKEFRSSLAYYVRDFPEAAEARRELMQISNLDEMLERIETISERV
ncbi:MAG: tRNA-dihydrouridine synthase [Eubacteriales bacterium]|nr:tRNA-dihydrouridine synthase [Eubacteriales bacterium]